MEQDLIKYLPPEITTNILSRLDLRTIASSMCVCKPWLDLLETDGFVKFHLSRSPTALAVLTTEKNSSRCTVFELEDEIDVESSHDDHYNHPIKFNFLPNMVTIEGSANGMLFLHRYGLDSEALYVCNPITREYIELHCPQDFFVSRVLVIYGFGASKITGQYKVVSIKCDNNDCHVYTLGTGSWRRVEPLSASFSHRTTASGAFVNGNLHWLVDDPNRTLLSCCFDLETECFSTFSVPPVQVTTGCPEGLSALRDCLCVCDHTSENEIALWLMKEYGDDKSWTKEYVINLTPPDFRRVNYAFVYPINVFKDGDVLMLWNGRVLFYYSNKTKTTQGIGVFDAENAYITSMLLTPSFLSLKSFPMENVISL